MSNKDTFLKLYGYILPDYNPDDKRHKTIAIPSTAISHIILTTMTNSLTISATLTFSDIAYSTIIPYISHKYPPVILLHVTEEALPDPNKPPVLVKYYINQLFFINNIEFISTTNRMYLVKLQLISAHAAAFTKICSYSNNNVNWSKLNVIDDINGIFKKYSDATGCAPRFELTDDVFGVAPSTLKRRYVTAANIPVKDAILDVVRQLYYPANRENLISEEYTKESGDTVATRLVGYTIDLDNNSPCFFRLNTDAKYSIPVKETKFTKKNVSIRFNGETSVDNLGATVAMPVNSSYMTLMQNFTLNKRFIYFDQVKNAMLVNSVTNDFETVAKSYLYEDTGILSDSKDFYVKSNSTPMPTKAPSMPVDKLKYNAEALKGYIQYVDYDGLNTECSRYDDLINETLTNNVIYLNMTNSIGHKVGQTIDLIVNEMGSNNAELNYNLNLAFSGKWKIVASNWEFINTGAIMQCNETLSLTRCKTIVSTIKPNKPQLFTRSIGRTAW